MTDDNLLLYAKQQAWVRDFLLPTSGGKWKQYDLKLWAEIKIRNLDWHIFKESDRVVLSRSFWVMSHFKLPSKYCIDQKTFFYDLSSVTSECHWWMRLVMVLITPFIDDSETHDGVQDMACDTFIKIAQKCRRHFVQVQVGEVMPFIDEILNNINTIICDLQPQQVSAAP